MVGLLLLLSVLILLSGTRRLLSGLILLPFLSALLLLFVLILLLFLRSLLLLTALVLLLLLSPLLLSLALVLLLFLLLLFRFGFLLLLRRLSLFLLCVQGSNASKEEQNSRTDPSNSFHDPSLHYRDFVRPSPMTPGGVVNTIRAYDLLRAPMTSRTTPPTNASPPRIGGREMCS